MKVGEPRENPTDLAPESPQLEILTSGRTCTRCGAQFGPRKLLPSDKFVPTLPDALFRLNSVIGQVWLMQLRKRTQQRYTSTTGSPRPALQTGYGWRSFSTFFEPLSAIELVRLFENLMRFASYDGYAPSRAFFLAYAPLAFEHDMYGAYIGPGVWTPPAGSQKAAQRVRRTLQRWCDWMEALIHFQVHHEHCTASMSPELDKAVILLWPLLKQHHWSYADLLALLRSWPQTPVPFAGDEEFGGYSRHVLGLYCQRLRTMRPHGKLYGQAVAERLLKFLPSID
jgi:hypothetical protein